MRCTCVLTSVVRCGEGKHASTSTSGAVFALALSDVPSESGADAGDSDGAEEYEDDEWESEDETDGSDPDVSEARTGGEAGTSGPLSLERSFRERFASVNGVLSAIAAQTSGEAFVDGFRVGAGAGGTGGNGDFAVGRRDAKPSSSLPGDTVEEVLADGCSPSASPDLASLPPTTPGGGDGLPKTASRLSAGKAGEAATAGGVGGGLGGRAGEEGQMPAEMSGMLQRYSEMMLRVVQVKHTYVGDRARVVDALLL